VVVPPISGQSQSNPISGKQPSIKPVDQTLESNALAASGNIQPQSANPPSIARPPSDGFTPGLPVSPSISMQEQQNSGMSNVTVLVVCFCAVVGSVAVVAYVSFSTLPRRKQRDIESKSIYKPTLHVLPPPVYFSESQAGLTLRLTSTCLNFHALDVETSSVSLETTGSR
jgi:hypothetical protein